MALSAAVALLLGAAATAAGDPPVPALPAMPEGMDMDGVAGEMIEEIVVTGPRVRSRFDAPAGGHTLSGDALLFAARPTLGDTLAGTPGVSSTSFGPGASRPVLRGFQGERTRLLADGIGSLDVSNTSPDHAVAINPLVADRIEILRGPTALLYASGATGGIVNTINARLPTRRPDGQVAGVAAFGFASAADEFSGGARLAVPLGDRFAVTLDGHALTAGDLGTGGYILGPFVRAEALASPDPAVRALADRRGVLPNTSARTRTVGASAGFFDDGGSAVLAVSWFESLYGLPTRVSLDPANPTPDTRIDLGQLRIDARAGVRPGGNLVDELRLRFGYADYGHDELLADGSRTARFENDAWEGRADIVFADVGPLHATAGLQASHRDFRVTGPAPLLPPTLTDSFALFALAEFDLAPWRLELAARAEDNRLRAAADPILGNDPARRRFRAISVSGSAALRLSPSVNLSLAADYSERPPSAEELFTRGVDPGTQGVLLGNPALAEERSWGIEATVRGFTSVFTVEASAYFHRFSNFIFAADTGVQVDGLPVFAFASDAARYWGFDAQLRADIARAADWRFEADLLADYARADLLGAGGPVPRIPPFRLLAGAVARNPAWSFRAEAEWTADQGRTAAFETATDGFLMLNADIGWRPFAQGPGEGLLLAVSLRNLFDREARRHASFLKDFAPIAGRDIRLSARLAF